MAEVDFTQKDMSRFKLKSYGWRDVDINTDRTIYLLEKTYQSSQAIEGIIDILRKGIGEGIDGDALNGNQTDRLLAAVQQLAGNVTEDICSFASDIESKIEARKVASSKVVKS